MKNYKALLGVAIVSGCLAASLPARADTAYHRVYHEPVTATDLFSKLDKYQNNALTPDEFKVGGPVAFNVVDTNHDGFVTRDEFYNYYNRTTAMNMQNTTELTEIQPAAGGGVYVGSDCTYTDNIYCETRPPY